MDSLTASIWKFLIATLGAGLFGSISLAIVFGAMTGDHEPQQPTRQYETVSETSRQVEDQADQRAHERVRCAGVMCAPRYSPDGHEVTRIWEDGGASYEGSAYYFDAEDQLFDRLPEPAPAPVEPAPVEHPQVDSGRTPVGAPQSERQPQEDEAGWSCMTNGNRICGPGSGAPAGCYRDGELVIPWTRYDLDQYGNPSSDPLWAQLKSPC